MIQNGKKMDLEGHHLVFESEIDLCRGCFFADKDSCPDCDEGIWVEDEDAEKGQHMTDKLLKEASSLLDKLKFKAMQREQPYRDELLTILGELSDCIMAMGLAANDRHTEMPTHHTGISQTDIS